MLQLENSGADLDPGSFAALGCESSQWYLGFSRSVSGWWWRRSLLLFNYLGQFHIYSLILWVKQPFNRFVLNRGKNWYILKTNQ